MITTIEGKLSEATPLQAIIETGGLGYEVHIPVTTAERLPPLGQTIRLHTLAIYREDSANLYGFYTRDERDFFRLLIEKVSGIGPKIALSIMSRLSLEVLRTAIASGDTALLSQCPGIGKKTAERLIIELKDKVSPLGPISSQGNPGAPAPSSPSPSSQRDAIDALIALGYKPADADKAVRKALTQLGDNPSIETLLRAALSST